MTKTCFKFKDSKSEWIGNIPSEWDMATVRNSYEITLGKMVQPESKSSTDTLVPYLKAMNVQDSYIKTEKIEKMYASKNEMKNYQIRKGDLLVCEGGEVARSTVVLDDYEGYVFQNSLHRVKAKNENSIDYLHYLLIALRNSGFINILVNKATIAHFTKDKFNSLKIPLPTVAEQKKIASYIKGKESEILRLIEQKGHLIELLEEKRQSIITEAVTKGLNPNMKMKDSGVEWIGEIPEHWELKALKRNLIVCNGREIETELDRDTENAVNVYGSGGVFKKTDKALYIGESVMFGRKGTIGKPLYVNKAFWTVDTMYYTRFYKKSLPKFFYYLLLVFPWDLITTHTALPSVVGTDVGNSICAIPPYEEQELIVKKLDDETLKIDEVICITRKQIQKLKEYRQSLIYEAVTGKIDVHELIAEK